jgi:hypothetical protein
MSKKLADLDGAEKAKIDSEIDIYSIPVGIMDRYGDHNDNSFVTALKKYGLCGKCKHMRYASSQFRIRKAYCYNFTEHGHTMFLYDNDPIVECTQFDQRGVMDLYDMKQIAWLIDPPRDKIGLI